MARYGLICLLIHPEYTIVDASGKKWRFELHPYCGPFVLNRRGDPLARQPSESRPFWGAFAEWDKSHRERP